MSNKLCVPERKWPSTSTASWTESTPCPPKARVAGAPVLLIQHEETDGSLQYGTEGWQLYERLAVQPEDIRVRKTTPDSFHKTELQSLLQARNVETLVVCG